MTPRDIVKALVTEVITPRTAVERIEKLVAEARQQYIAEARNQAALVPNPVRTESRENPSEADRT